LSDPLDLRPLPMPGASDYHVHCDYSIDAEGTIEEYCEAALRRELSEICFTTHYDANPGSDGKDSQIRVNEKLLQVTPDNLRPYVDHVQQAAIQFYPKGLSVKLGVEIGWFPGCEESTSQLLERYPFDYVLCGVHELDNQCFCCRDKFRERFGDYTIDRIAAAYFEQTKAAIESGLFDCIAHLCYYVKYGAEYFGEQILTVHQPYLPSLFDTLIRHGVGLEVNTSGIRRGSGDYYPMVSVVNAARKAGVAVEKLGSDAHRPEEIGADFEAAAALVPDAIRGCSDF